MTKNPYLRNDEKLGVLQRCALRGHVGSRQLLGYFFALQEKELSATIRVDIRTDEIASALNADTNVTSILDFMNARCTDTSRSRLDVDRLSSEWEESFGDASLEYDPAGSTALRRLAEAIRKSHVLRDGETWVDPSFRPDFTSLFAGGRQMPRELSALVISWKRPRDFGDPFAKTRLFANGPSPKDIVQGLVGDCYLLAALSALAEMHVERRFDVRRLIDDTHADIGLYGVKVFCRGRWITVPIDTYIPVFAVSRFKTSSTKNDPIRWEPCFAQVSSEDSKHSKKEIWVQLIEKAHAKVARSYTSMQGVEMGSLGTTLTSLTGCEATLLRATKDAESDDNTSDVLWRRMRTSDGNAAKVMLCTLKVDYTSRYGGDAGPNESCSREGLVINHAYAVIGTLEVDETLRLVRLRNPWGHTEWNGAFSKHDEAWEHHACARAEARLWEEKTTSYEDEESTNLRRQDALVRARTGRRLSFATDNGMFWMRLEDFLDRFDVVTCDVEDGVVHRSHTVRGSWIPGRTAGGRPKLQHTSIPRRMSMWRKMALSMVKMSAFASDSSAYEIDNRQDVFRYNERFKLTVRRGECVHVTLNMDDRRSSSIRSGEPLDISIGTVVSLYLLHPKWLERQARRSEEEDENDNDEQVLPIELIRSCNTSSVCLDLHTYESSHATFERVTLRRRDEKEEDTMLPAVPRLQLKPSCMPRYDVRACGDDVDDEGIDVSTYLLCVACWQPGMSGSFWLTASPTSSDDGVVRFHKVDTPAVSRQIDAQAMSMPAGCLYTWIQRLEANEDLSWDGLSTNVGQATTKLWWYTLEQVAFVGVAWVGYKLYRVWSRDR